MKIKTTIKKIGRFFIALKQEDERIIGQSVLFVDNGYSWIGHLESAINKIKDYFPKSKITILTFEHRKSNLQKGFPDLKFIVPPQRTMPKRYRIALQMLKMRGESHDLIILFSLDITPLIVSIAALNTKAVLYNQWGQWWSLKLKDVSEIFKTTYIKKKANPNIKNLLKRAGLFPVLLERKDEEALKNSILIVDNGYAVSGQVMLLIQRIKEFIPQAKISVLAIEQRRELKDNFPNIEVIKPSEYIINKYRIARHMLRLRKNKYDYIILLSLDITPIITAILMDSKMLLYNQWHQWWSFKPNPLRDYLMLIPKFIYNVLIFLYLLISVLWIFLKRLVNIFIFNLLNMKGPENYGT